MDWGLDNSSLQEKINDSSVPGKATTVEACVHSCTVIGDATRQGKYLRFPERYAIEPSWTSSSESYKATSSHVIMAPGL